MMRAMNQTIREISLKYLHVFEAYKVIYFIVIDKIMLELEHHFGESKPILNSIAALSPKNPSFLKFILEVSVIRPLAMEYNI